MKKNYNHKPIKYFALVMSITWISLFIATFFSYNQELNSYQIPFILLGMLTPFLVALWMIYRSHSPELIGDFKNRIFNLKLIKGKYWLWIVLIMPLTLLIATLISVFLGQSPEQFYLSRELFTASGLEVLFIMIILALAPTFEELGWRGYGVDSLRSGKTLIKATLIFAILWNIWHWPLFLINGYYQNELIHTNLIYALNFIISIFPAAFLMNWLYYKNNRSITAIIIFHVMLNLFSVLLQTEQFTKCIITILLLLLSGFIWYRDREFFKQYQGNDQKFSKPLKPSVLPDLRAI